MTNTLLENCVGKEYALVVGSSGMGGTLKGTVLSVQNNWLELQPRNKIILVNLDMISNMKPC